MTVTTMLWQTNGTGDGTASGYTDAQTQRLWEMLHLADPTKMGVVRGEQAELAVTVAGISSLEVDTGSALINGIPLFVDTSVVALTTPAVAADTAGLVYAQISHTTQTGLISRTQQTSGNTTVPTPTQSGTVWQIPLASYIVDSGGVIYTDTTKSTQGVLDLRRFIGNKSAGGLYKIGEFVGDGTTGVCTFAGIQAEFDSLIIEGYGRSDGVGTVNNIVMTFNSDGGSNYSTSNVTGQNGTASNSLSIASTSIFVGNVAAASAPAGQADPFNVKIPNSNDTNMKKGCTYSGGSIGDGTNGVSGALNYNGAGWWTNTAQAITRIDLTLTPGGNWDTGTKITLYGMR